MSRCIISETGIYTNCGRGSFDGVKLGGIRIDLDVICGKDRCSENENGEVVYKGNSELLSLSDAINPNKNKKAKNLYGETGGFQAVGGEWNLHFVRLPYSVGSLSDRIIESFAGSHDMMGGQIWRWYDKQGNTLQNKNRQDALFCCQTFLRIKIKF